MGDQGSLAKLVCETGRRLYERGYIAATEGNISCRISETEVLCTPSMVSKGCLSPQDLCVVDLSGSQLSGARPRSSEILLHLEIYKNNPDANVVIHCHPPYATALAISRMSLPKGLLAEVEVFLQDIPTIEYLKPGTAEFAKLIVPHARTSRCAILKNHGAVSWDCDLERARWWMEILEAYCRAVILAKGLGEYASLSDKQIEELRESAREIN